MRAASAIDAQIPHAPCLLFPDCKMLAAAQHAPLLALAIAHQLPLQFAQVIGRAQPDEPEAATRAAKAAARHAQGTRAGNRHQRRFHACSRSPSSRLGIHKPWCCVGGGVQPRGTALGRWRRGPQRAHRVAASQARRRATRHARSARWGRGRQRARRARSASARRRGREGVRRRRRRAPEQPRVCRVHVRGVYVECRRGRARAQ